MSVMRQAGRQFAFVLIIAGAMVIGDTIFQFHQWRNNHAGSETFAFPAGFIIVQEVILFGGLAWFSLSIRRSATPLPIRLGYVTVLLLYLTTTLVTMLIFNFRLLPYFAISRLYYGALIARTAVALLFLGVLHVARRAQREGQGSRNKVDDLLKACDRIRVLYATNYAMVERTCSGLGEQIRFCEGLRRNQSLVDEIATKLAQLESVVSLPGSNGEAAKANQLIREISLLATRQH